MTERHGLKYEIETFYPDFNSFITAQFSFTLTLYAADDTVTDSEDTAIEVLTSKNGLYTYSLDEKNHATVLSYTGKESLITIN